MDRIVPPAGTSTVANPESERLRARQAVLAHLTAALQALVRKLGAQREVAVGARCLVPQAEDIARQARMLAFARGRLPAQALAELAEAICDMAAEAERVAGGIERGASLGSRIVATIGGQLTELAAIARDPVRLADPLALRGVLTTLSGTLKHVSAQRQGADAAGQAVLELGQHAAALSARARRLAEGGGSLHQEVLALSRDLGIYATEAARVAAALCTDAEQAEKVLGAMAGEIRNIADPAAAPQGAEVDQRIAAILPDGQGGRGGLDWGVARRPA